MSLLAAACLAGGAIDATAQDAARQQWQGPARAELRSFAQRQKAMLHLPGQIAFYGDFTGDGQEDAVLFIYADIPGAAGNFSLKVALFRGEGGKYRFLRYASGVYGTEPRDAKFSKGKVEVTLATLRPTDARCCPTGSKRYSIDAQ